MKLLYNTWKLLPIKIKFAKIIDSSTKPAAIINLLCLSTPNLKGYINAPDNIAKKIRLQI